MPEQSISWQRRCKWKKPDNKKEQDGKANKYIDKFKDFLKKFKPKKKKSDSNETPPLFSPKDAREIKDMEMESVAGIGATYHTDFEEQDEETEELENLLEKTKEPNIPDQQNVNVCDTFPATEQVENLTTFAKDAQGSALAQTLVTLAKAMQMDPKSAKQYQQQLQFVIRLAAKSVLEIHNIHCLLSWTKIIYPNFLRKHINEAQLGELLSTDEIRQLEDKYTQRQMEDLKKWWKKALEKEENGWKQNPARLYEISHIIIKMFIGVINAAKEIPDDFESRVMPMMESEFLQFLKRYKSSFNNYQKKNRTKSNFREIIITNIYYCSHSRDFVKHIKANEEQKQNMNIILQEIERKGDSILLQNLFKDEECNLKRLSNTKGLNSLEIMRKIISKTKNRLSSLSTLSDECRQVVAAKIHVHLVTKYLTEIKEIRNCDIDEQKSLATQMVEAAKLLKQFSTDHLNVAQQSEAAWANDVIHKVASIIASDPEDLEIIKLEVGFLGREYPDIRKRHVKSFLCIKNNLSNSQRMSAVNVLDTINREDTINWEDTRGRHLFTNIPCWPCHFLRFW